MGMKWPIWGHGQAVPGLWPELQESSLTGWKLLPRGRAPGPQLGAHGSAGGGGLLGPTHCWGGQNWPAPVATKTPSSDRTARHRAHTCALCVSVCVCVCDSTLSHRGGHRSGSDTHKLLCVSLLSKPLPPSNCPDTEISLLQGLDVLKCFGQLTRGGFVSLKKGSELLSSSLSITSPTNSQRSAQLPAEDRLQSCSPVHPSH